MGLGKFGLGSVVSMMGGNAFNSPAAVFEGIVSISSNVAGSYSMGSVHGNLSTATAGMVKAVWSDGKLMGIAAVGHGVSHLVTVAQLLIKEGYTVERLHEVMFAHPTLDEIVPAALRAPRTPVTA